MKKRLLASLLAGVMVLGTLAGCGGRFVGRDNSFI